MIDIGVASPSAHGQAMISTATAFTSACASRGSGPNTAHARNVMIATTTTAGTKYDETTSASRWIGARVRRASLTMRMICGQHRFAPHPLGPQTSVPVPLTVPPISFSPGPFLDRDRLAGDHRLVDGTRALDHHAVDGNLLAGTDPQPIAAEQPDRAQHPLRDRPPESGEPSWGPGRAKREWHFPSGDALAARAPGPAAPA